MQLSKLAKNLSAVLILLLFFSADCVCVYVYYNYVATMFITVVQSFDKIHSNDLKQ